MVSASNEGQTFWDSCFYLINPVLLKRNELAQGTHLIGTKLQIQVSGKYFRTVSVTSSGVRNCPEDLSDIKSECDEMKNKSTIDNSKQARPISVSCFSLRRCQKQMLVAEVSYGTNSSEVSGLGLIGKKSQPSNIFCWSQSLEASTLQT